jgi:hypothetical protein
METFQALVDRYEASGWVVRTLNQKTLRAFVRSTPDHPAAASGSVAVAAPAVAQVCRKLWVDSTGQPQETDVPC